MSHRPLATPALTSLTGSGAPGPHMPEEEPARLSDRRFLTLLVGTSTLILFLASMLRHALHQSNLFDLGIFDQALYLLSRGLPPISTTMGFHILGDHSAFILYPLSVLYAIFPHVGWLFFVQALSLSLSAIPIFRIALHTGLSHAWARTLALSTLLYPSLFNTNLFDFHPEVIALPALLWGCWAALTGRSAPLIVAVLIALSCKEVVSLTVLTMGAWLFLIGKKSYGMLLAGMGATWFVVSTRLVIPAFSGSGPAAMQRYPYLGETMGEMVRNVMLHPELILGRIFSPEALGYYLLLLCPLLIALHLKEWKAVVPALPMLLLNVLAVNQTQRDLIHQYSLLIFPFLLIAAAHSIKRLDGKRRWLSPRVLTAWSLVAFLALAKVGYFGSLYLSHLSNRDSALRAIALIDDQGSVLTTSNLAAQLSQRPVIEMTIEARGVDAILAPAYDHILLDLRHPAWPSSVEFAVALRDRLLASPAYTLTFQENEVILFQAAQEHRKKQKASPAQ
ncbi:hypothetical protein D3C72_355500 [compost metagenome]